MSAVLRQSFSNEVDLLHDSQSDRKISQLM
jgi:hypothetical protein